MARVEALEQHGLDRGDGIMTLAVVTSVPSFVPARQESHERIAPSPLLNDEQRRSQISDGHRLLRIARQKGTQLYSQAEFHRSAVHTPASYWLSTFLPALKARMNEAVALRVTAAIARARKQSAAYGVKKLGVAEYVAEAFFDKWWFNIREENLSRAQVRDTVKAALDRSQPLSLRLPILSRKAFSPLKNRGPHTDLAEIHTLARCAEAAQVVNALSPTGCQLHILADGFKYNRACRTPTEFVTQYQESLRFWTRLLEIDDVVRVVDYEGWVTESLPPVTLSAREPRYREHCAALAARYSPMFSASNTGSSLETISATDDVGQQLAVTFASLATSVFYKSLFSGAFRAPLDRYFHDDVQRLYVDYASTLDRPLRSLRLHGRFLPSVGHLSGSSIAELFAEMRREAWEAAIRYVAISLTDRDLAVLKRIDGGAVKLTIHAKKGELHFVSDRSQGSMTAQHAVAGISESAGRAKLTLRYRVEREAEGECPVLVEGLSDSDYEMAKYGPLYLMQKIAQPIVYVPERLATTVTSLHLALTRKE